MIFVFGAYVINMLLFAAAYFAIYLNQPQAFAFNSDILRSQAEAFKIDAASEIKEFSQGIELLDTLINSIKSGKAIIRDDGNGGMQTFVTTGLDFVFTAEVHGGGQTPPVVDMKFTVIDKDGKKQFSKRGDFSLPAESFFSKRRWVPENFQDALKSSNILVERWSTDRAELERKVGTIGGQAAEVWGFADFVYFSAITQSTVGYGDILPNSTAVRLVVVLQLIISTILLVVVINMVVTSGKNSASGESS